MINKCRKHLYYYLIILFIPILFISGCGVISKGPSARFGAKMIFDPVGDRYIMFGGRTDGLFGLRHFNDLWAYNPGTMEWSKIKVMNQPSERLSPGMTYDPVHHQIIIFGGLGPDERFGDTWLFNLSDYTWEEVDPPNSPPPRSDMGLVYDHENEIVILFGGYCREDIKTLCDDTWFFDPGTNNWSELNPDSPPPIMYGHTLVYNQSTGKSVLWGGHMAEVQAGGFRSTGYGNTLWSYDSTDDTWEVKEIGSNLIPAARYWHQAVYNSIDDNLFIYGGDGGSGFLSDSWIFDFETLVWEKVISASGPAGRVNPALAYDPVHNVILLFGGLGEDREIFDDTWMFDDGDQGRKWKRITGVIRDY